MRCVLAVILLALGAAPAAAAPVSVRFRASGAIVATWEGAKDRCQAAGVCGIRGSITYAPSDAGTITVDGRSTSQTGGGAGPQDAVVRVERAGATCVDVVHGYESGLEVEEGRLVLGLGAPFGLTLTAAGCAGPRGSDVAAALPRLSLSLRRVTGVRDVDLSGTKAFTAGPFDGQVSSTLHVAVRRVRTPGGGALTASSFSSSDGSPAPVRRFREAQVTATYKVTALTGSLNATFASSAPTCDLVDGCGLSGRESWTPAPGGTVTIIGTRRLGRAGRAGSVAQELGRSRIEGFGMFQDAGQLAAEVARYGGDTCRDALPWATPEFALAARGTRVRVSVGTGGENTPNDADAGRTRCPGPPLPALEAVASLRRADLLGRQLRLQLVGAERSFTAPGFTGATAGDLALTLERTSARVRTSVGVELR